ncbi:MAG TPA: response regulator transcription factor [Flavobacterium sp.]|jgi:DNA-binding NarL/FixJ family response regulator
MKETTIGIIDDHKIVRNGLKELLQKISNYRVIAEFDSGEEFLESLPLKNKPDLFILDYSMRQMNGIDVLKALEAMKGEEFKVILLTQHFDESIIDAAYSHGARAFLHKNCTAAEMKAAIDNVISIGYNNITDILKRVRNYDETSKAPKEKITLTERENEFLKLVCDERELTYQEMAQMMGVSSKSIDVYRTSLFDRYKIKSKVGLVLFAHKYKLAEPFL